MSKRMLATLIGFLAILMWALLAFFTVSTGKIPPFQLTAMTFLVGSSMGLVSWIFRPAAIKALKQPPVVWITGIGGLFGYHYFYFTALRNAPAVEAGLIAYLWPLLIVLFSALLPGEKLRWHHICGALLGLAGCILIVTGGNQISLKTEYIPGYLAALVCALTWSGYSVISRKFAAVPTDTVVVFCFVTAVLSAICHFALEDTVMPSGNIEWLAVLALGLLPVGAAFYVWDHGVKHGDIQLLGAASYAAPLLSTAVLIAAGIAEPTWVVGVAALLITLGAILASKSMLFKNGQRSGDQSGAASSKLSN